MSEPKQTIDQAYKELQSLVEEFEHEEVNLDTSIPKFKRGLELAAYLKDKLGALNNEVKEIKEKFEEKNGEVDMSEEPEDSKDV